MSGLTRVLIFVIALLIALLVVWSRREFTHPPGVLAPDPPYQDRLGDVTPLVIDDYVITPKAEIQLRARVLSAKRYWMGRETDLSPIDLALGWGSMSDSAVLESFDISQSGRWYFWRADHMPIPRKDVTRQSANMHMIPADDDVSTRLKRIKKGQVIELEGYLVDVRASDGWRWRSSMTRNDTGDGSCELIYVLDVSTTR